MAKRRSDLRNRLELAGVRLLLRAAARGTPAGMEAAGRRLGRLYRALDRRRRDLAEGNLARAFPGLRPDGIEALSIAVFEHFGGMAADLLHAFGEPQSAVDERIEVVGVERVRSALAAGRGLFLVTAHFGNWEYSALATAAAGVPVAVIARPLDNPLLETFLREFRERNGNTVVYKADAAREMLRILKRGGGVGILADQHARTPDAMVVPFFGRPASTTSIVARLADRTEALIIPAFCFRTGPARYRMEYGEAIDVRTLSPGEREPAALTARLNLEVEGVVRRAPEQWLWLHNRWRLD
ncbi:MAG TPA: lysophospholipid acyltransferase family protein [Thermoanaerobaculia bacterium]|nr:lysophospholipid acyltransferase family protein [Thermoanaerobaculia bacterium]